jgi:DNA recombination protein RmuC
MNIVFFLIGLISGLIMAGLVYVILHKRNEELKKEVEEVISLKATNQALQNRMEDIRLEINDNKQTVEEKNKEIQNNIRLIAQYKTQNEAFIEKLDNQKNEILNLREELNKEFKLLANEILDEKTKKFSELNEEKISTILNPLKEKIQTFEKKVEETYNNETREKASLRKELEQIININRQMSEDAQKLTSALKGDSKTQGDWGECQLELLLEKTGLQKGVHFLAQPNFKTEEGSNLRPDYIINLPENKNFIIDS